MMTVSEMQCVKKELNLSYEDISRISGVPFGTVQKVLSGTTRSPRYQTLCALDLAFRKLTAEDSSLHSSSAIPNVTDPVPAIHQPLIHSAGQEQTTRYEADNPHGKASIVAESGAVYGDVAAGAAKDLSTEDNNHPAVNNLMHSGKYPRQGSYTLQDYWDLPDDQRAELIDGVIYDMSAPTSAHQIICVQLTVILSNYIDANHGNCQAFFSPIDVQLDKDEHTMVEPDVCIVCDPDKIHKEKIYGAPDLAIEVLSPSTRRKDMTLKVWKYANAGVREYWIVDPDNLNILVYDFGSSMTAKTYSFHDQVPVSIYSGKLQVDFEPIYQRIQRFL